MKRVAHFILFAYAGITLVGCANSLSYSGASSSQMINLTQPQIEDVGPGSGSQDNFSLITRNVSRGSIEVFSLDQADVEPLSSSPSRFLARPSSSSVAKLSLTPPKGEFAKDPSVKLYPFEDKRGRRDFPSQLYSKALAPVPALVPPSSFGGAESEAEAEVVPPLSSIDVRPLDSSPARVERRSFQERSSPVATVYFDHDSSYLGVEAEKSLAKLVALYNHSGGGPVFVEGHASKRVGFVNNIRRKTVNLKVSMDRAFNVTRALIEAGLPAEVVETRAYGESRPAEALPEGLDKEMAARRVEIQGLQ